MRLLFENDELENLISKYNLMVYFNDGYYCIKYLVIKNKRHTYIEVEPFEKHLNELIIQRKRILADMKELKMKEDFK